jgi:hypothetical protein
LAQFLVSFRKVMSLFFLWLLNWFVIIFGDS